MNSALPSVWDRSIHQLNLPPKFLQVAEAWPFLPPHVQETIVLLSELRVPPIHREHGYPNAADDSSCTVEAAPAESVQRFLLRALRHAPEGFGLDMDREGWVSITQILQLLAHYEMKSCEIALRALVRHAGDRVETDGHRIRATYGHSCEAYRPENPVAPSGPLFHGTSHEYWQMIQLFGLVPGRRRFVQLTSDFEYAQGIADRLEGQSLVLQVQPTTALSEGVRFYSTGTHVWLATHVPVFCLQIRNTAASHVDSEDLAWDRHDLDLCSR